MTIRRLGIVLVLAFAAFVAIHLYKKVAYTLFVLGCSFCRDGTLLDYAVEVAFKFSHEGRVYEKSFLTLVRPEPGAPFATCAVYWKPTRSSFPIDLEDGSTVVVTFRSNYCDKLSHEGDGVSGKARWLWFDRLVDTTRVIQGHFYEDAQFGSKAPWLAAKEYLAADDARIDVTLRRAPDTRLAQADEDDRTNHDVLSGWRGNVLGTGDYRGTGPLYVQVQSTPAEVVPAHYDWVTSSDGCRVAFLSQSFRDGLKLDPKIRWNEGRNATRVDEVWDLDRGPSVFGPTVFYPAQPATTRPPIGTLNTPTSVFEREAKIARHGKICTMPAWPDTARSALVDFGEGDFRHIAPLRWIEAPPEPIKSKVER
jgi:hypothetical protein